MKSVSQKCPVLGLLNIWRLGHVKDNKSYIFYCFLVIKIKPTGGREKISLTLRLELTSDMLRLDANVIHDKKAPWDNSFGKVDGAKENHRVMHNGHKMFYRIMVLQQVHMIHKKTKNTMLKCCVNRVSWQLSNAQYKWSVDENNYNLGFHN